MKGAVKVLSGLRTPYTGRRCSSLSIENVVTIDTFVDRYIRQSTVAHFPRYKESSEDFSGFQTIYRERTCSSLSIKDLVPVDIFVGRR